MGVPPPDLRNRSIEELLALLPADLTGSAVYQQAMFMLNYRIAEKQAEAAAQQAATAPVLARLTGRLVWATYGLVIATVGLIVATVVPFMWR